MIKRLFALTLTLVLLSGCAPGKEVESVAVAVGAGVDILDGKTALTVETVDASFNAAKGKAYTSFGKDLSEAIANMVTLTGKPLYWEHLKFMLISKDALKTELENVLERIMQSKQSRIALPIAVTDVNAADILFSDTDGHPFISDMIENEISTASDCGLTVKTPTYMAYNGLHGAEGVTVFPYMVFNDEPKTEGGIIVYENLDTLNIDSSACFALNLINGRVKSGIIEGGGVSAGILKTKRTVKYTDKLTYHVDIKVSMQKANGLSKKDAALLLEKSCYDGFNKLPRNFPGLKNTLLSENAPQDTDTAAIFKVIFKDSGQEK